MAIMMNIMMKVSKQPISLGKRWYSTFP